VLGFFSFTEVTDPGAHEAYNEWHQFDHLPEQLTLDGIHFGQRWVCSPWCRQVRVKVSPLLEPCQYMTLYLLRDADVLPSFFALAERLRAEQRFFASRHAHLAGPYEVTGRWAAPQAKLSAAAVPFRPTTGIYVVVGPPVDGASMSTHVGVVGVWQFTDRAADRHITVAFLKGSLSDTALPLGEWCLAADPAPEWAGPLERIEASQWGWFARLTSQ
jgi:hypothetical protein